jgi:hypothetical protein
MNPKFKKLALAASISAGLGATTMPAQAMLVNEVGEALLVPLVTYDFAGTFFNIDNTYVKVMVPGSIGFDTVPYVFTAPNVGLTNEIAAIPPTAALNPQTNGNRKTVHWYWFDENSEHQQNGSFPVTPNDVYWFDWKSIASNEWAGDIGYLVLGDEEARDGSAATFAMAGEAYLEMRSSTARSFPSLVPMPVLPMIDGPDLSPDAPVSVDDNVKYGGGGIPRDFDGVSPLYSGMRTSFSDGDPNDFTVFNLTLGDRQYESVHMIWLDRNNYSFRNAEIFNSDELSCSWSADAPDEINLIEYEPWVEGSLCDVPEFPPARGPWVGHVQYWINERIDNNLNLPETSGVAWSVTVSFDSFGFPHLVSEGAIPQGTFKQF